VVVGKDVIVSEQLARRVSHSGEEQAVRDCQKIT
jgi:hypothetical protein